MLKICTNGHITGTRNCAYCESKTPGRVVIEQPTTSTDKRVKRRLEHQRHQQFQRNPAKSR